MHLFVFNAAPELLDEHVVAPSAFAVHADGYSIAGECAGEGLASDGVLPRSCGRRPYIWLVVDRLLRGDEHRVTVEGVHDIVTL